MKRVVVAIFLAVVLVSQIKCAGARVTTVAAATIAALPPGTMFEVDLTRNGTVYDFKDAGTDFSRVAVRTTEGVQAFSEVLKGSETNLRGGLVLGTPADMRNHLPKVAAGGNAGYTCGVFCNCDDVDDCTKLLLSGECSAGYFWCDSITLRCFCVAKP